jgi:hypothetical protein
MIADTIFWVVIAFVVIEIVGSAFVYYHVKRALVKYALDCKNIVRERLNEQAVSRYVEITNLRKEFIDRDKLLLNHFGLELFLEDAKPAQYVVKARPKSTKK